MRFEFLPVRFEFIARERLFFPPGKAANVLRGALGIIFRRIACAPDCLDARTCNNRHACPYAKVFAPVSDGTGPSGLADPPRPFVFRARHLDGRTIEPGETFHFDLNVFSLDPKVLSYFSLTFAELAREGLGPTRGKADLTHATVPPAPRSLDLSPLSSAPPRIRVEFLSPTELKHEHRLTDRPEFPILFARLRDRIGTLRTLYGPGPLDIDFQATGIRAAAVRMTKWDAKRIEAERRSTRTGQTHSLGGFIGVAEYEGDLSEFLPYLNAGRWTGVGRQSVWGKGEFSIRET